MNPRDLSSAGRRELALIQRACDEGLCCLASIAAWFGATPGAVCNWLAGRRSAPPHFFAEVLAHLSAEHQAVVLGWQAEALGVGTLVSLTRERALRQLHDAATAYLSAAPPLRRAA